MTKKRKTQRKIFNLSYKYKMQIKLGSKTTFQFTKLTKVFKQEGSEEDTSKLKSLKMVVGV